MHRCGIDLNRFGFAETGDFTPNQTSRPGIFVAGAFEAPMDIPESVMGAASAAALSGELLSEVRRTLVKEKIFVDERDIRGEEPRVGVFVCHCGSNIARIVNVPEVAEYARTLPNVVHAESQSFHVFHRHHCRNCRQDPGKGHKQIGGRVLQRRGLMSLCLEMFAVRPESINICSKWPISAINAPGFTSRNLNRLR